MATETPAQTRRPARTRPAAQPGRAQQLWLFQTQYGAPTGATARRRQTTPKTTAPKTTTRNSPRKTPAKGATKTTAPGKSKRTATRRPARKPRATLPATASACAPSTPVDSLGRIAESLGIAVVIAAFVFAACLAV